MKCYNFDVRGTIAAVMIDDSSCGRVHGLCGWQVVTGHSGREGFRGGALHGRLARDRAPAEVV